METNFILSGNLFQSSYGSEDWKTASDYISKSGLTLLKQSPAHFKYGEPPAETPDMLFGRMYHCFILQPEKFEKEYFILEEEEIINSLLLKGFKSPRSTGEYKAWMKDIEEKASGKTIISKADFERLKEMRERLMEHPYTKMLLSSGIAEQGIMGKIQTSVGEIGVKFIPDQRNDKKRIILELKTARNASRKEFPKEAVKHDYHIQAAMYSDLMELFYGDNRPVKFFFIVQEKEKPYAFNLFEPSAQFIQQGRYEYQLLMQLYKYCLDNDYWPGYQVFCSNKYGIEEMKLPSWGIENVDYFIHNKIYGNKEKLAIPEGVNI